MKFGVRKLMFFLGVGGKSQEKCLGQKKGIRWFRRKQKKTALPPLLQKVPPLKIEPSPVCIQIRTPRPWAYVWRPGGGIKTVFDLNNSKLKGMDKNSKFLINYMPMMGEMEIFFLLFQKK